MIRTATARWMGDVKKGSGIISTQTGAIKDQPYSLSARVENAPGTNPEELAGAALAGCFSMKFSGVLTEAGMPPDEIRTTAKVQLDNKAGDLSIPRIELECVARVPKIEDAKLQELGQFAKANCPIGKLFKGADISLKLTRG